MNTSIYAQPFCLNSLSVGVSGWLICTGINIIRAPNLMLKIASTQVITSTSVDRLEILAKQLKEQAGAIERKDKAYQDLEATYHDYLTNETGGIELDEAFDKIEKLPEVKNIEKIQKEISETEEKLLEMVGE